MKIVYGQKSSMSRIFVDGRMQVITQIFRLSNFYTQGHLGVVYGVQKQPQVRDGQARFGSSVSFIRQIDAEEVVTPAVVRVRSKGKGKGFQGVHRRWGHSLQPRSHGGRARRRPGSLSSTQCAKVWKGKKSPGRAGGRTTCVYGRLEKDILQENLFLFYGSVPGPKGCLVEIVDQNTN